MSIVFFIYIYIYIFDSLRTFFNFK